MLRYFYLYNKEGGSLCHQIIFIILYMEDIYMNYN